MPIGKPPPLPQGPPPIDLKPLRPLPPPNPALGKPPAETGMIGKAVSLAVKETVALPNQIKIKKGAPPPLPPAAYIKPLEGLSEEPNIDFQTAAKRLLSEVKPNGFRLEGWRIKAINLHKEIGLFQAVIAKGIVENEDEYKALFDEFKFTPKGLQDLINRLNAGEDWEPTFDPGNLTYPELWNALFLNNKDNEAPKYEEGPTTIWMGDSDRAQHVFLEVNSEFTELIKSIKEVDPKNIAELSTLDPFIGMNEAKTSAFNERYRTTDDALRKKQRTAYQDAYTKAPELKAGSPQVLFTQKQKYEDVVETMKSPIEHALSALNGYKSISPMADLIRIRQRFMYGSPGNVETQFPLFVTPKGTIFCVAHDWNHNYFWIHDISPGQIDAVGGPKKIIS